MEWIMFVHEVRKADHVTVGVVERDVEVLGGHQLAHDPVNGAKQVRQGRSGVGRLRDPVGGDLDLLGAGAGLEVRRRLPATPGRALALLAGHQTCLGEGARFVTPGAGRSNTNQ